MQIKWTRLITRLKKIPLSDWRVLFLLVCGAFFQGMASVYLDVGTLALFLKNHGLFSVGFDFLCLGVLLSFLGRWTVKLDRRHGFGGVPLTGALIVFLIGLLTLIRQYGPNQFLIQTLFIYRYIAFVLTSVVFWSIATRFIVLRFNSFKFLGVLTAQLLGFLIGGLALWRPDTSAMGHLNGAVFWLILLCVVLKILVWLLPMPSETFVRKSGGVQDASENKMVVCILWMAFLYTCGRFLSDYFLYHALVHNQSDIGLVLSGIWFFQGLIGLGLLVFCYRFAFIYLQILGLWGILLSFAGVVLGMLLSNSILLYLGMTFLGVLGYLCWPYFLRMLPQLLSLGQGRRLRWRRQVVVQPLAIVFIGAIILTLPVKMQAFVLWTMTLLLGFFILLSLALYSRFLLHMCQMRRWCFGPLMLISNQVIQHVRQGLDSNNVDDVIYFIRLMQQADYPGYKKQLLRLLHHPSEKVRLFVLDKLDMLGIGSALSKVLKKRFDKETDNAVRCRLLALLIRYYGEQNTRHLFQKFGSYLDDKNLQAGAVLGFLQAGGESALLAMDGLQKMAQSLRKKENLKALDIIDYMPQTGLVRLILPLLKSSDVDVMRHALLTAGRIGHVQALSFVLSALDTPAYQESALSALKMYGVRAFPPIEKMLANPYVPLDRRKKLILFLMMQKSGQGKQVLIRNANIAEQKLRKDILKAILDSDIILISRRRKKALKQSILNDIERWHWLQDNIQKCRQAPDARLADSFAFLTRSFEDSIQDTRLVILYQLMLLYPESVIERAVKILLNNQTRHYETAISLLQDLLPRSLWHKLYPILMNQADNESQPLNVVQATVFLSQLVGHCAFSVDRWVQSCALYGLKQIGNEDLLPVLKTAFHTPWPIVWEAALDNLDIWIEDPIQKKDFLNSVMLQTPNLAFNLYLKQQEHS